MYESTTIAPEGKVWVCLQCGKTSLTKSGLDQNGSDTSALDWDECCKLHSELFDKEQCVFSGDKVVEVK